MSNIIKVKDNNGNWIGIPALQGNPGITPHIGDNGNWFLGEEDTGVKANIDLTPYATIEAVNQAISNIDIPTKTSQLTNDSGFLTQHQDISNLATKAELPTKISELSNDSNFITNTVDNLSNYYKKSETYTQIEVNNLINSITTLNIEVVSTLPTSNISSTTIYLKGNETTGTNDYEEWLYVNGGWELIGTTAIDLSPYATKTYVGEQIAGVTKSSLGLENVENKSSATIRGEITSSNVTTALGFTPTSLALGETSSTAYRGDRGKTAYDHSQLKDGSNPHLTTFANIDSKPTTLAGYGITDAKIASGIITLGSNTITPLTSSSSLNASNISSGTIAAARLPKASASAIGGIRVGTGLTIDSNGILSATGTSVDLSSLGITATAAELNKMDGVTATTAELNYVDGVTSNIQTQLNAKAATSTVLTKTNTTSFTPTADYHPATKKYVDDAIAGAITTALGGSY